MAYTLQEITLRTNNTKVGLQQIDEIWNDIMSGVLPVLFDSKHNSIKGISPVSRYSDYANNENGDYNLSILGVQADFFSHLDELVSKQQYVKYETCDITGDLKACTKAAWLQVWQDQQTGKLHRSYTKDYESSVPAAYTNDGKAHCYLYIAVN